MKPVALSTRPLCNLQCVCQTLLGLVDPCLVHVERADAGLHASYEISDEHKQVDSLIQLSIDDKSKLSQSCNEPACRCPFLLALNEPCDRSIQIGDVIITSHFDYNGPFCFARHTFQVH